MRIAISTQTYDLVTNGQGVFAVHLAEGLAKSGHDVMVIKPSERKDAYQEVSNGVLVCGVQAASIIPFHPEVKVTLFPGQAVDRLLGEFYPEVVHIQDYYPLCRAAAAHAQQRGIPLLGTNHFLPDNILLNVPLFELFPALTSRILWGLVLNVYNHLDVVTSPTETAAKILKRQGLIPPVKAISCGVNADRFSPDPQVDASELRIRYHLDPEKIVFLYVGRIDGEKCLDVLIRGLALSRRKDLQLAFAGHGADIHILQNLAEDLGVGEQVVFTGYLPEEDHPALLNSVDFFAMPSVAELQSLSTLEAMSTGLPVLADSARALPELVHHKVNGYLFKPDDPEDAARGMIWLVENMDRWHVMSAASLEIAGPHRLENTVQQYEALYEDLILESHTEGNPISEKKRAQRKEG